MSYRYVDGEGEVVGPVDLQALRQLRARGELRDTSSVSKDGDSEWKPLTVYLGDVPLARGGTPAESAGPAARPAQNGAATARAVMGAFAAATRNAAHAFGEAAIGRESAVTLDSLAGGTARSSSPESPTEAALARVVAIHRPIGQTPLPGQHLHTLRRAAVLFLAFLLACVMGVYTRGALDAVAERREAARQEAEAQRQAEEERRREEEAARRVVDERYQDLAQRIPAARLQALLQEAGSREALVRLVERDYYGNWTLREE